MLFGSPSNVLLSGPSVCPRVAFENPTNGLAVGFSLPPPAPYTVVKPRFSWHFCSPFSAQIDRNGRVQGRVRRVPAEPPAVLPKRSPFIPEEPREKTRHADVVRRLRSGEGGLKA